MASAGVEEDDGELTHERPPGVLVRTDHPSATNCVRGG
jgi:hypothetical protein